MKPIQTAITSFRLPLTLLQELRELAISQNTTLSKLLRQACEKLQVATQGQPSD